MATLNFTKTTIQGKDCWVAEIAANDVVNVHFERNGNSAIVVKQRVGNTGGWGKTKAYTSGSAPQIFDENLVSDYYPINWRIESYEAVSNATLNE